MSFRFKTIAGIALIEAVLLAFLIWNSLHFLLTSNQERLAQHANITASLFASTAKDAVLATDLATLESFVNEVLQNEGLVYARVLAEDGVVLAEIGQADVLQRAFQQDHEVSAVQDGVFDASAPVAEGGFVFGHVQIGFSTHEIDQLMAHARQRTTIIAAAEMVLVSIFSWFLGTYLTRQLKDLRRASAELASGDLTHRVAVKGNDELAETATAFNAMTEQLEHSQNELKDALQQAEQASTAKSEFLSRMSHELRTPMNAVLGFTELMRTDPSDPLSPAQKESTDYIMKAGQHLLGLINEILDLARIESGRQEISIEAIGIQDVGAESLDLVSNLAQEKSVKIVNQLPAEPLAVLADRTRLRQILLNLLSNAIKYNVPGGSVTLKARNNGQDHIIIDVIDSGRGMSKEEVARVFEPFSRMGDTDAEQGTGIGLTITKRLVEIMHGEMGVTSQPGRGSHFWVSLKATELADYKAAFALASANLEFSQAGEPAKVILYVEDNPANFILIERIIAQMDAGIEVIGAPEAEQGLNLARNIQPDLILMDINLPGMNGYEALAELHASHTTQDIPVIAISANATAKAIEKGKAAGFDDYLTKPVEIELFRQTLVRYLGNKSRLASLHTTR